MESPEEEGWCDGDDRRNFQFAERGTGGLTTISMRDKARGKQKKRALFFSRTERRPRLRPIEARVDKKNNLLGGKVRGNRREAVDQNSYLRLKREIGDGACKYGRIIPEKGRKKKNQLKSISGRLGKQTRSKGKRTKTRHVMIWEKRGGGEYMEGYNKNVREQRWGRSVGRRRCARM